MTNRQYNDSELCNFISEFYFGDTTWERGRKAALQGGSQADNPEIPNTFAHYEWKKGFVHGAVHDVPKGTEVEEVEVTGTLPVIEVQVMPVRSFWAVLNNLQIDRHLTIAELARWIGMPEERLCEGMMFFGFYDPDAIPMHDRVAV